MIHLFLSNKNTSYDDMLTRNGDIIIKNVISAKAVFERNSTWYIEIEFPKSELLGMNITDESVFKVDLNFEKNQLYRIVYPKYQKSKDTYICYATHVFLDSQKEVFVFDDRTMNGTWANAIVTCNDIIKNSNAKQSYTVNGDSWQEINCSPQDDMIVYFKNYKDPSFCIDIPNASEDANVQSQLYTYNKTSAQTFLLKKSDIVNGYQTWGILSLCSCRWLAYDSSNRIVQGNLSSSPAANEKWVFIEKTGNEYYDSDGNKQIMSYGVYKICSASNLNSNIHVQNDKATNGAKLILYNHGISNIGDILLWNIVDAESIQTAYWVRYNLIQCMFGNEDNSMVNRWPECKKRRYVAMFDNCACYFGNPSSYTDYAAGELKPNEYIISNRELSEYTKKKSMEKVVTGIIPKAYNGRVLPNNEIVKSSKWDSGEIHRIEVKEYSDIILQTDNSEAKKTTLGVFINEENLQAYMRVQARKTLAQELQEPATETSISFEELFSSNVPNANHLKINDVIYVETEMGTRDKFYINKLIYNLCSELPEDMDLVLESEV